MAERPRRLTGSETDAHLNAERRRADAELGKRIGAAEREADQILETARRRAAEVLRVARRREDERLLASHASDAERSTTSEERDRDDQHLQADYAKADLVLTRERQERALLLSELIEQERDETDRSLLLERADAAEVLSRRDDFLGMVSHDLRNELSGIALGVAQLIKNVTDDERGRKVFRTATNIQRVTLRMSRLIGDLLDIVSIEAGKFTVVPEDNDARRTVGDAVESFLPIAAAKQISLTARAGADAITAHYDHQRILQVVGNLLSNALKFTPPGGRVTVGATRATDDVSFSVADTGPGVPADRLHSIFDRFSQSMGAGRTGLGLGLYIAKRIVDAHRGRIWVESEPERGSTFRFTLPLGRA